MANIAMRDVGNQGMPAGLSLSSFIPRMILTSGQQDTSLEESKIRSSAYTLRNLQMTRMKINDKEAATAYQSKSLKRSVMITSTLR